VVAAPRERDVLDRAEPLDLPPLLRSDRRTEPRDDSCVASEPRLSRERALGDEER